MELSKYVGQGVDILYKSITNVGKFGLQVLLSLILSLFFLLEKARIVAFTAKFKESRLAIFYTEIEYFGKKFARSFGKVIEAQFLIAVVNCVLSVIALWILGFPQLLGLALMIFLLGLIPVAGVIISLFPLCMIAYNIGGIMYVVYILVIVTVIHALESYVLNPKFMSQKQTYQFLYVYGINLLGTLLRCMGINYRYSIFIFLLDVLDVTSDEMEKDAGKNKVKRKKHRCSMLFLYNMMFLMPYCKEKIE